jgi:hypothetical protein
MECYDKLGGAQLLADTGLARPPPDLTCRVRRADLKMSPAAADRKDAIRGATRACQRAGCRRPVPLAEAVRGAARCHQMVEIARGNRRRV